MCDSEREGIAETDGDVVALGVNVADSEGPVEAEMDSHDELVGVADTLIIEETVPHADCEATEETLAEKVATPVFEGVTEANGEDEKFDVEEAAFVCTLELDTVDDTVLQSDESADIVAGAESVEEARGEAEAVLVAHEDRVLVDDGNRVVSGDSVPAEEVVFETRADRDELTDTDEVRDVDVVNDGDLVIESVNDELSPGEKDGDTDGLRLREGELVVDIVAVLVAEFVVVKETSEDNEAEAVYDASPLGELDTVGEPDVKGVFVGVADVEAERVNVDETEVNMLIVLLPLGEFEDDSQADTVEEALKVCDMLAEDESDGLEEGDTLRTGEKLTRGLEELEPDALTDGVTVIDPLDDFDPEVEKVVSADAVCVAVTVLVPRLESDPRADADSDKTLVLDAL